MTKGVDYGIGSIFELNVAVMVALVEIHALFGVAITSLAWGMQASLLVSVSLCLAHGLRWTRLAMTLQRWLRWLGRGIAGVGGLLWLLMLLQATLER